MIVYLDFFSMGMNLEKKKEGNDIFLINKKIINGSKIIIIIRITYSVKCY